MIYLIISAYIYAYIFVQYYIIFKHNVSFTFPNVHKLDCILKAPIEIGSNCVSSDNLFHISITDSE